MENKEFSKEMIVSILQALAKKNHFFVSEAHLQTEFIIEASKEFPNNKYYPELVPSIVPKEYSNIHGERGIHFDLLIKTEHQKGLVEFKYVTNNYTDIVDGMYLKVKSHMAMDVRRYDCWSDIERIESFVNSNETKIDYGYFILITNVPALWNQPGNNNTVDEKFHIEEGLHQKGIRTWKESASKGTIKGRELPITTKNDYLFKYALFFDSRKKNGLFKSLIVEIDNQ